MIVTFGDAIVDLFAEPLGCDVADATSFVPKLGGGPLNVAIAAARLGAASRFVGAVGRDAHGDRLVAGMRAAGVDDACVVQVPERTGVTFVRVGRDGSRSFLFYRQHGADHALAPAHLTALATHPLGGAHWLHVTSSALVASPLADAARWLLDEARFRGVPVVLDLNVRAHLWNDAVRMRSCIDELIGRASLVKASEEDLVAIGVAPDVSALALLVGSARGVLTLAERGAALAWGSRSCVPAPVVTCVDATGAGDAFVAATLAHFETVGCRPGTVAWDDEGVWRAALFDGCRTGARAVTAMGATDAIE